MLSVKMNNRVLYSWMPNDLSCEFSSVRQGIILLFPCSGEEIEKHVRNNYWEEMLVPS